MAARHGVQYTRRYFRPPIPAGRCSYWCAGSFDVRYRTILLAGLVLGGALKGEVRRALLIGIGDYSRSVGATLACATLPDLARIEHVPRTIPSGWQPRPQVGRLEGPANDVRAMRQLLVGSLGFEDRNILCLTNRQATSQ